MTVITRLVGVLLAIAVTAGGVALSNVEMNVAPEDEAIVRLSWRATAKTTEHCRTPTEAELAATPLHMRRSEICEGRLPSFHLAVSIDGETRVDRELRPAGAREDRPTYVLEVLPVSPGPHDLSVVFSVMAGLEGQPPESVEPPLELTAAVDPGPRDVVLVTRDEWGALVIR